MKPIRLLLADDLMLIRHGIRALLSSVEDVDIVGEVSTADDAVRLARGPVPGAGLMGKDMPRGGRGAPGVGRPDGRRDGRSDGAGQGQYRPGDRRQIRGG